MHLLIPYTPQSGGINLIFGEGQIQNHSYLELAMKLQEIQDDVFDALGIEFPKWNGVPLTLKNIEHPLCEFQKYLAIHKNLQKNMLTSGQRRIRSRTEMDCAKACHNVESCGVTDDILFCDKCLVGFCEECAPSHSSSNYWVCPRCMAFEAVSFE